MHVSTGVYVLHAQNQPYLLPVRGGYDVTNVASQASCVLHSFYYEAAEQKRALGVELV